MRLLGLFNKLRWPKWEAGRQNSGYKKMQLASSQWPIPHDLYLLHFPKGSSIPPHTEVDPIGETTIPYFLDSVQFIGTLRHCA
jgi:hypothetical protein